MIQNEWDALKISSEYLLFVVLIQGECHCKNSLKNIALTIRNKFKTLFCAVTYHLANPISNIDLDGAKQMQLFLIREN